MANENKPITELPPGTSFGGTDLLVYVDMSGTPTTKKITEVNAAMSLGISGYSGYSGRSGASGYSGFSGLGTSGYSGFSGAAGGAGGTGTSGFSGFSGPSGYSGYTGVSGYSGIGSIIPINSQSTAYPTVLSDAGQAILHPTADNNPRTFTIDGSVSYPVGSVITFINQINTVSIAIGTDTLTLYPSGATGTRTLAAQNVATAIKVASGVWVITGTSGLS